MSEHIVNLNWTFAAHPEMDNTYNRNHKVAYSDDEQVMVSASPEYKGDPACADPEKVLTGALASCHMLTFLAIAEVKGFKVESYADRATGYLEKGESGRPEVTRIELQPTILFSGENQPDATTLKRMHASAHKNCFIANSIKAHVEVLET